MTRWRRVIEAPFTSSGSVTMSSTSSMRAGLRKSMVIERTTKANPGASFSRRLEQRAVVGADEPQIIGAAALHVAQIIGVIDDAGEVGVLVIDAHGEHMAAVADFAVERNAGHASYLHGTRSVIACSQFLPSKRCGLSVARSTPSRQRTLTSILSGSERGM